MKKKILHLHLKAKYFYDIKLGIKTEEYRLFNSYWCNRLDFKTFDEVHILNGYPKKDDLSKRIIFPWMGYDIKRIKHPEFGKEYVEVYAIRLIGHEMKKIKHPDFSKEYYGSYEIRRRA